MESYSKQSSRQQALQAISEKFDMTLEHVKRKIHTIRSTYNQMRIKVMEAEATGRVYQPSLAWYDQADFLDSVITLRKNRDSLPNANATSNRMAEPDDFAKSTETESHPPRSKRSRNSETTTSIRVKVKPDTGELLMEEEEEEEVIAEEDDYQNSDEQIKQQMVLANVTYHQQGYEDEGDGGVDIYTVQDHTNTNQEEIASVLPPPPPPTEAVAAAAAPPPPIAAKDEIALFCDLMDNQLRAMSVASAIETMCKIQSLITEARLLALSKK